MPDYYTEEDKLRLDELSGRASKLGYSLRRNARDPLWLGLLSLHPEYLDESERALHPSYSLDELEKIIAAVSMLMKFNICGN